MENENPAQLSVGQRILDGAYNTVITNMMIIPLIIAMLITVTLRGIDLAIAIPLLALASWRCIHYRRIFTKEGNWAALNKALWLALLSLGLVWLLR